MKIKELPKEIRYLAVANQLAQGNVENLECEVSGYKDDGNFDWVQTPEGPAFWNDVYNNGLEVVNHSNGTAALIEFANWYRHTSFNVDGHCDEDCVAAFYAEVYEK